MGNPDGDKGLRYRQILESFNPTLATMKQNIFMDYSIGATVGNQISGKKWTWGYNVALSYKNNTEYYENAEYGRYGMSENPGINVLETRELQSGDFGINNVLLSGLAGIAIKSNHSKIRINFLKLQNGESKAGVFDYQKSNQGTVLKGSA